MFCDDSAIVVNEDSGEVMMHYELKLKTKDDGRYPPLTDSWGSESSQGTNSFRGIFIIYNGAVLFSIAHAALLE